VINILEAILAINPTAKCSTSNEDIDNIRWDEGQTPISKEDIQAKQTELQAEYDAQAYARNRKAEYDQLNQFEMQFDDDRDGTTTWVDTINEIKGRHPK
jgi:hypothetical protein